MNTESGSKVRVIVRLDIKGPNLVKGVHMEGLRVLGRPELFAPIYYRDGADELIYIDTVASLYGRNNLTEIVERAASEIFIPLTVGGGVRGVDDIKTLLRSGADKVAINTAAIKDPSLIRDGARRFGSQCVVVSIQAVRRDDGRYECLTDNARERTGVDALEWARKAADLGAGELLLTSVDREGTGQGYDVELVEAVSSSVGIPVIACGGAGRTEHVVAARRAGADALCAASLFHYGILDGIDAGAIEWGEGNMEFLKRNLPTATLDRKAIHPMRVSALKAELAAADIPVRLPSTRLQAA